MHTFPRLVKLLPAVFVLVSLCFVSVQAQTPNPQPAASIPAAAEPVSEVKAAPAAPDTQQTPEVKAEPAAAAGTDTPAAVEAEEVPVEEAVPFYRAGWFTLVVFFVLVAGSFWAGGKLAKRWRLPDHSTKIAVVLLAFFGSFAALSLGWHRLTLGIDLQGGVVLVYDAKPAQRALGQATAPDGDPNAGGAAGSRIDGGINMDQLTRAITRRINPGGVREIAITKLGTRQIQVVIPHAEAAEVARIERVISESGALSFRILASKVYPQDADIIARAQDQQGSDILDSAGRVLARWVPVFESEKESFLGGSDYILRQRGTATEALVLFNDGVDITGEHLTYVGRGMGENGSPGVSFNFNAIGENKFGRLTGANRPDPVQTNRQRHLGIILNDSLYSAPVIRNAIKGSGIIEFASRHTDEERAKLNQDIDDLISILDAGALPAELSKEPVGRQLIGATLGNDTIQKAKYALIVASVVIIVFMVVYYRLAGLIASFCVITNLTLLVAVMLALRAAFTLPGLAGLMLTIGMAVDANILIYERIREELAGGSSLKMAIRNGYAKAFSAIFDSNITTILTGVVLYWIGTEQVKGFAVTLVLGIALNMFTAIYCARVIMDVLESRPWCKTFSMMQFFKRPNINFLAARKIFAVGSIALIIVGITATVQRGRGLLDIDFVGGVSVETVFNSSQNISDVRSKLYAKDRTITGEENRLNDLAVQNVQLDLAEDGQSVIKDTHFIVTTSIPQPSGGKVVLPDEYLNTVRGILKDTFGEQLEYSRFSFNVEKTHKVADYDETTVSIKRFPKINYDAARSEIGAAIKKAAASKLIDGEFSVPDVTRSGFREGDQTAFEDWTLTFHAPKANVDKILAELKTDIDGTPNFPTSTTVGGSVASSTRVAGMLAVLMSFVLMALYIGFRFHYWIYGLIAVIGLLHDVLIVLGLLALSTWCTVPVLQIEEFKIGLPVIAAFLTIIGYSINDTIILFDRIRENLGKSQTLTYSMINKAINQTLSRTVLTAGTTFLAALILFIWGGQGIHTFAFAMTAGVFFGTYSTIGVCSALLFWAVGVDDRK
ncbi:MAG: protein translocase subunit SecD [Planctomycetaceae bacterium]|jgi:SecD/SecF fusion protein|nr:protein translocase subunit SecD [Planctomycetaceae bacterium]